MKERCAFIPAVVTDLKWTSVNVTNIGKKKTTNKSKQPMCLTKDHFKPADLWDKHLDISALKHCEETSFICCSSAPESSNQSRSSGAFLTSDPLQNWCLNTLCNKKLNIILWEYVLYYSEKRSIQSDFIGSESTKETLDLCLILKKWGLQLMI